MQQSQQNTYAFEIEIASDWNLELLGAKILPLKSLFLQLEHANKETFGTMVCAFSIAEVDIRLMAMKSSEESGGGWQFSGSTGYGQDIPIGELMSGIGEQFGINEKAFPTALTSLSFSNLALSFDTVEREFKFSGEAELEIHEDEYVDITVYLDIKKQSTSYDITFSGQLTLGALAFDIEFSKDHEDTLFVATYTHTDTQTINIKQLVEKISPSVADVMPDLSIEFKDILVGIDKVAVDKHNTTPTNPNNTSNPSTAFFFGLHLGTEVSLSHLPLVDKLLNGREVLAVQNLQVFAASQDIQKAQLDKVKQLLNSKENKITIDLPETISRGIVASIDLNIGGHLIPLHIDLKKNQVAPKALPQPPRTMALAAGPTPPHVYANNLPAPSKATSDGTTWVNIQKSLGPVHFQKIGVKYNDGVLWFLFNASFSAGGLTIDMMGLGAGSPLKKFEPHFTIEGLGIDYSNPSLELAGAFIKLDPPQAPATLQFAGGVVARVASYGITAVGTYAKLPKGVSLFIFAKVSGAFGGPPYFFITGFEGGFGYNSKLRIPEQDQVTQFPFVAGLTNPDILGGHQPTPLEALEKVLGDGTQPAWVVPEAGEFWIAIGIEFTTFKLLNTNALLVVEFGKDLIVAIIGLSKAKFPQTGKLTYAYIELQLEAVFDQHQGVLRFSALLSPNSFLLDPACHLTGGFAFYTWFHPNEHAGDFVLTLGGYSSYFSSPVWYPQEPRLGINWSPDSHVSIVAGAYFALTPAALMAGGALDVRFHDGNLQAWFTAHLDIVIWWEPFHFIADMSILIGVAYKLDVGALSKRFKVELGVDLKLWGPPTGGKATIHWWVISFNVSFGKGPSKTLEKQTWGDFVKVLPQAAEAVKFNVISGLQAPQANQQQAKTARITNDATPTHVPTKWIVRKHNFSFEVNSAIPAYKLFIGSKKDSAKLLATQDKLHIQPMQQQDLVASKRLYVERLVGEGKKEEVILQDKTSTWTIEPIHSHIPKALWGKGNRTDLLPGDQQLVNNQLVGYRLAAPAPSLGHTPGNINIQKDLSHDPLDPGQNPLRAKLKPSGPVPQTSDQTIQFISKMIDPDVKKRRADLYATLQETFQISGLTNKELDILAQEAGVSFVNEPLLINNSLV